MKARLFCALLIVFLLTEGAATASVRYEFAKDALVRLQVRAAGDTDAEQNIKLIVRDAVRSVAVPLAADAGSPDEALAALRAHRHEIRSAAVRAARGAGYQGPVSVDTGMVRFPVRVYGEALVPPGEYRALRVTLGAGAGRNWWCVVYPDLCATDPNARLALKNGEPIEFYSSIGKWFKRITGEDERP